MDFEKRIDTLIENAQNIYNRKDLLIAEENANQAYNLCINFNIENQEKTAQVINLIAVFLFHRKKFNESIFFFNKAIKCLIQSDRYSFAPVNYDGLANVFQKKGDYENALNYYSKAIMIAEPISDSYLPTYFFGFARILKITNRIEQAIQTYQKSISTAKEMIGQQIKEYHKFYEQVIYNCYNDLSEIYLAKDEHQKSKKFHQQALQVLNDSESGISAFFEAYKRFEIPAKMLVYNKEFKEAIGLFNQAETAVIEEYQGFEVGKDLANIIHQIGECYTKLNENEKALDSYQNALKTVCNDFQPSSLEDLPAINQIYNKRSAIASLSYKASAWLQLYHKKQNLNHLLLALQTYQLIVKLLPITRRDYVEENSKFQLADETKGIYEKAIETCLKLYHIKNEEDFLQQAFQFSESSKAIVLQEKLQADFALQGMEESVQQKDIDFRSKIAFYQSSINTSKATKGDTKQLKSWEGKLWECKEAYERFQQKIEQENPNYYAAKYVQSQTTVEELQKKLSTDTAVIEFFTGTYNLYVFVITKNTFTVHCKNTNSQQQVEDIQLFKTLIHQFNKRGSIEDYQSFKNLSYQLYQKILEPALQSLDQLVNRLIIIPDGLLYHITFEALLTSKENQHPSAYYHPKNLDYIFKSYAVSYCYSASMLLNANEFKILTHAHSFSSFAPLLDDLQHNQKEAKQINACFNGELFLEDAATVDNFKEKASQSQIIHLATHAKCNDQNSKLSRIEFNGEKYIDNSIIENFKITSSLMVLSACETGTGFIQNGEGTMSLARSFFLAGCPSLVASMWRANDKSTATIMLYFYQHLKNGATKDVALQKAKLQYCEESGLRESHPFYWAGFVQYGNRKALF